MDKKQLTLKSLLAIALPMIISQASETLMLFAGLSFFLIKVLVVSPVLMWIFLIFFILSIGFILVLRYRSGKWEEIKLI